MSEKKRNIKKNQFWIFGHMIPTGLKDKMKFYLSKTEPGICLDIDGGYWDTSKCKVYYPVDTNTIVLEHFFLELFDLSEDEITEPFLMRVEVGKGKVKILEEWTIEVYEEDDDNIEEEG